MSEEIRILVIDDEKVVHESIHRILSRFGYEVTGILSPTEGLVKLEREKFDVVITDLMMPEMNGLEMLIAMQERKINIPSIMITGYPTIKTAIQAQRLGAVDYIPKPFTRVELLGPLNRALRRVQKEEITVESSYEIREATPMVIPPKPGDCFYLPEHSWGVLNREGMVEIGIEDSFLSCVPPIREIILPIENDLIEQGHPGIELRAKDEVHRVFMPLSGRVASVNNEAASKATELISRTWLIKIIPSSILSEASLLQKRNS